MLEKHKVLHSKGNYKQDENTTLRMGENICKRIHKGLISKIYKRLMKLSIKKTKTTQSKNGQKTSIDIFPKKTYRWPRGTRKAAQHH